MTRKDEFLRAIQSQPCRGAADLPFTFGLALNLAESSIPPELGNGARRFVAEVSSPPKRASRPPEEKQFE